jgi:hypothetical protein
MVADIASTETDAEYRHMITNQTITPSTTEAEINLRAIMLVDSAVLRSRAGRVALADEASRVITDEGREKQRAAGRRRHLIHKPKSAVSPGSTGRAKL